MHRPMRRFKQELPIEFTKTLLLEATSGVLSLLGDDDYPYGVPLSHVYDGDLTIYFHSALSGHKMDAIAKHQKCSFTVVSKDEVDPEKYTTYYQSVIVFGQISVVEDLEEKRRVAIMLGNRFSPNPEEVTMKEIAKTFERFHMLQLKIEHMTGKESMELVNQRRL